MIRELQVNVAKNMPTTYIAKVDMVTGMGAQIDVVNGEAILPAEATSANLFMVEKERIAEGIYAGVANLDDYFEQFVNVKAGEKVKLIPMYNGEHYGTDQFDAALTESEIGKPVACGVDGKWALAAATSRFMLAGFQKDGTHTLAVIHVLDTAIEA